MTYEEAIQFLYTLPMFGANFSLENSLRLAARAGHPERQLRFIHVAGTNGKGSTCAFLDSIYRAAGRRVGLFTSPHLISFTERIQLNGVPIPREAVAREVGEIAAWLQEMPVDQHPTFFEMVMLMALRFFAREGCDVVIWETGLGGRLDATNIVMPLASVITSIDLDHQQWLGTTLADIAREKAGIIKTAVPVITAAQEGRGLEVIRASARAAGSALTWVRDPGQVLEEAGLTRVPKLSLEGEHQRWNAAVAVATVGVLRGILPVESGRMARGLAETRWPGRFQVLAWPGGRTLVLDGAHNPAGALAARGALQKHFSGEPEPGGHPPRVTLVLGALSDKSWDQMAAILAPVADLILVVPVQTVRTTPPTELAAACRQANPAAKVEVHESLESALAAAARAPFPVIFVTGSLYLIGEALEKVAGLSGEYVPVGERTLNEWTGTSDRRTQGPRP